MPIKPATMWRGGSAGTAMDCLWSTRLIKHLESRWGNLVRTWKWENDIGIKVGDLSEDLEVGE